MSHLPKATLFISGRSIPDHSSLSLEQWLLTTVCCFEGVLKDLEHQKALIYSSRHVQRHRESHNTQWSGKHRMKRLTHYLEESKIFNEGPIGVIPLLVIMQMNVWELLQRPLYSSGSHLCSLEHLWRGVLGNIRINPISQWSSTQSKGCCLVCAGGRGLWIGPWFVHVGIR